MCNVPSPNFYLSNSIWPNIPTQCPASRRQILLNRSDRCARCASQLAVVVQLLAFSSPSPAQILASLAFLSWAWCLFLRLGVVVGWRDQRVYRDQHARLRSVMLFSLLSGLSPPVQYRIPHRPFHFPCASDLACGSNLEPRATFTVSVCGIPQLRMSRSTCVFPRQCPRGLYCDT